VRGRDNYPTDKVNAITHIARAAEKGEVLTGLLYLSPDAEDLHAHSTPTRRRSTSWARRTSARARRCCLEENMSAALYSKLKCG